MRENKASLTMRAYLESGYSEYDGNSHTDFAWLLLSCFIFHTRCEAADVPGSRLILFLSDVG